MSRRWDTIDQRRREVRRLKDRLDWSIRKIARHLGVSVGTVHADLKATDGATPRNPAGHLATIQPAPNPAGPGNARRRTHGAYSEPVVGPHRQRRHEELVTRYPWKRPEDLMPLADRLGRIDAVSMWEVDHGIVENDRGVPHSVIVAKERWQRRAEALIADLERERWERGGAAASRGSGPLSAAEWDEVEVLLDRAMPAPGSPPMPQFVPPGDYDRLVGLLARTGPADGSPRVSDFKLELLSWTAQRTGVRFGE